MRGCVWRDAGLTPGVFQYTSPVFKGFPDLEHAQEITVVFVLKLGVCD